MGNVKWIKINVDMFDDEKIKIVQSMPEGDALLIVWIKLITLAGKTNDGGYIYIAENMPYTDEMLSVIMNKPLNTIRLALDTFIKLGMIDNDNKGIYLLNFEKHQSLDKLEKIKEQNRIRVARHREKQKQLPVPEESNVTCNVTVTQSNATDIDIEKDKDIRNKNKDKYFNNESLNNIFIEFIEVRKKLKAVNSERAIKTIINKLEKYDDDTKYKMIENSIVNSWKDVYELKQPKAPKTYGRKEIEPEWFNKQQEVAPMTKEERLEAERLIAELQEKY